MLKVQRAEKQRKLEEAKEVDLQKNEKKYMESMDWCEKYQPLGWKTVAQVTRRLQSIKGKSNQIKELKNQINICTKGLEFDD